MPWVKLDDRFPSHRKIALLSDRAFRLHISAICWCAENLTDGRISDRELALVAKIRGVKATAQQLADAGVWDRTADGWESQHRKSQRLNTRHKCDTRMLSF